MKKILGIVFLLGLRAAIPAGAETVEVCRRVPAPPAGQFGCSVALHGQSLVVGSNLDGGGSITFCHQASETSAWTCDDPKVMAPDGRLGDEFGRSASFDGDWLAVGAPFVGNAAGWIFTEMGRQPFVVYPNPDVPRAEQAKQHAEAALATDPDDPEAQAALARADTRLKVAGATS